MCESDSLQSEGISCEFVLFVRIFYVLGDTIFDFKNQSSYHFIFTNFIKKNIVCISINGEFSVTSYILVASFD